MDGVETPREESREAASGTVADARASAHSGADAATPDDQRALTTLFASYRRSRSLEIAERIYRIATPRLRIHAATILADANDVDDVIQDAMLLALEQPDSWDGERPILPWLAGIVRNLAVNRQRCERRRKSRESTATVGPGRGVDPLDETAAAELFRIVEQGIGELPSKYRAVVVYRLLRGETSARIASELSLTENAVRVQLSRGLRMLRDRLPIGIGAAVALALIPRSGRAAVPSGGAESPPTRIARRLAPSGMRRASVLAAAVALVSLTIWVARPPAPDTTHSGASMGGAIALAPTVVDDAQSAASPAGSIDRTVLAGSARVPVEFELRIDGAPAAGAPVSFERLHERPPLLRAWVDEYGERSEIAVPGSERGELVRSWTSADGRLRFEAEAGRYVMRAPGNAGVFAVEADTPGRFLVDLSKGAAPFACQVRDASGEPCAAEIWCGVGGPNDSLTRLCETDASGRFAAVLSRGAVVQARIEHGASQRVRVTIEPSEFELALAPAQPLSGVVRATDGRLLTGATVELGDGDPPSRTETDARGRYKIPGVLPGVWRVVARDRGKRAGWSSSDVRIDGIGATELDVDLTPTATVVGRITDPSGVPMDKVWVRSGWSPYRLESASATTGADGRFELRGVSPGAVRVAAGTDREGFAQATLELVSGRTTHWNARLSRDDLLVAGVVAGVPDGVAVTVGVDAASQFAPVTTALTDGRFRLAVPPEWAGRKVRVRLYRTDVLQRLGIHSSMPIAVQGDVDPGDQDVRIVVAGSAETSGSVAARVVAPRGRALGAIRLSNRDLDHWVEVGRLELGQTALEVHADGLPAGSYALQGNGGVSLIEFDLAAGEHLDLGEVIVPSDRPPTASADVELRFRHPGDATELDRLRIDVFDRDGSRLAGGFASGTDGSWRLRMAIPRGPVTVVAGTPTGLHAKAEILVPPRGRPSFEIPLLPPGDSEHVTRR